jgi:tetratricopeptide (TPR) repeat protein
VVDRVVCLQALESIAQGAGDEERALRVLDKVANAGCNEDRDCARQLTWVAQQAEVRARPSKALALYRRAYERTPDDDDLLENIARLASTAGLHAEAADDYERLARRRPQEERWRTAADIERASAVKHALNL